MNWSSPTVIGFPITVFVVVSITDTVLSIELVTYILLFTGSYAIPRNSSPTFDSYYLICSSIYYRNSIIKMLVTYILLFSGIICYTTWSISYCNWITYYSVCSSINYRDSIITYVSHIHPLIYWVICYIHLVHPLL